MFDLDAFLRSLILRLRTTHAAYFPFFETLYNTGCRYDDLLFSRWTITVNSTLTLKPCKYNNIRTFNFHDVNPFFISYLLTGSSAFFPIPYSTLVRSFQFNAGAILKTEKNKNLLLHAFRHNYAKALKLSGLTDSQIQIQLGEKHLSSAMQYIYSNISI